MDQGLKNALRNAVGRYAPKVAGMVGGSMSEGIVRTLSQEVLGKPEAAPRELVRRLEEERPMDVAKLREVEANLERDLAQLANEDRADARARQVQTDDPTPQRLAYASFGALVAFAAALLFLDPQGGSRDLLMTILGALVVMAKQGYDFFLGSSKGSKDKTVMLGGSR